MKQRIFNMDKKQDREDFFAILPKWVIRIRKTTVRDGVVLVGADKEKLFINLFKINWGNRKKVDRPVDESKWIGFLCWVWDDYESLKKIAILDSLPLEFESFPYKASGVYWKHCRPVKRDEIKFVGDD